MSPTWAATAGWNCWSVLTPHIGGTLVILCHDGQRFTETQRIDGVSNHAIGSRSMKLSAFLDVNGDGVPEVVIPSPDRRILRAISFTAGRPLDFAHLSLPSPDTGDFEVYPPPYAGGPSGGRPPRAHRMALRQPSVDSSSCIGRSLPAEHREVGDWPCRSNVLLPSLPIIETASSQSDRRGNRTF